MFRFLFPALLGVGTTLATTTAVYAADLLQTHNSNTVWFENWSGLTSATLVVQAPDGTISQVQSETGTPVFVLKGPVTDGVYRFELRATPDTNADPDAKPHYSTGHFLVERGVIVTPEPIEEES